MKFSVSLADIMNDPHLSVTTSPFAPGKTIVKRASFAKGKVPNHLKPYLIKKGECDGRTGIVAGPRGPITGAAACVMEKHGGGKKRSRSAAAA